MTDHLEAEKLSRYFDGEVTSGEKTVMRRHLDECAACSAELKKLETLSGFFKELSSEAGSDIAFDAMFANVQKEITRRKNAGFGERFRLITGEAIKEHRSTVLSAVALTVAAAAALVLILGRGESIDEDDPEMTASVHGSEVEEVRFGQTAAGTVFNVENGDGAPAAVIWINDDE